MRTRVLGAFLAVGLVAAASVPASRASGVDAPPPVPAGSTGSVATTQDSLWAWDGAYGGVGSSADDLSVCVDPTEGLATCFQAPQATLSGFIGSAGTITTDGVNVYTTPAFDFMEGVSCPIVDLGANCTVIRAGGINGTYNTSIVADNGSIWIGGTDGSIWKCPDDLPIAENEMSVPPDCVLLDSAGNRYPTMMVMVNGMLYVALKKGDINQSGLIWVCDPSTPNSCRTFADPGDTNVLSVAVGGGYLWAGLQSGILWRCDLATGGCSTWDQAAKHIVAISYDGQGTLGVAVDDPRANAATSVVWSCPTSTMNACATVQNAQFVISTAASPAGVYSSVVPGYDSCSKILFGWQGFDACVGGGSVGNALLFIPAGGPIGLGAATVHVRFPWRGLDLRERCVRAGGTVRATVDLRGPHGIKVHRRVNLCRLRRAFRGEVRFGALDPGRYVARVRTATHAGRVAIDIEKDSTRVVRLVVRPV